MVANVCKIYCLLTLAAILTGSCSARADNPTPVSASSNTAPLAREFTTVTGGDPLYTDLDIIRKTGWSRHSSTTASPATSILLTRYEMALEVVKAIITVRAQQHADARWLNSEPAQAVRSLRALCAALAPELARFDVDAKATIALLDGSAHMVGDSVASTITRTPSLVASQQASAGASYSTPSHSRAVYSALDMPLSQRLRVHAAVSSLALAANDRFETGQNKATSALMDTRVGVTFSVTDRLVLRGVAHRAAAVRSGDTLENLINGRDVRQSTLGGGLDFALRPGVVLYGDLSHLDSSSSSSRVLLASSLDSFNGTKWGGGLGLSGWQNRVVLSAQLSRLVPEDSLALARTAAQLNLDVGLTEQVSLKLLYQQLFAVPDQASDNHVIAGGININF